MAPPLIIPDLDKVIAPDYERYDFGAMGAFDVYFLAKQYAPDSDAKQYYSHWRGRLLSGGARARPLPKNKMALIYFSRWDSPEAARAFATLYDITRRIGMNSRPSSSPSCARGPGR